MNFFWAIFFKYDKKAQLLILFRLFDYSETYSDSMISLIIFKNDENLKLFSGKIEDFEKSLELCKESEKQALIFFYITSIKNKYQKQLKDDFFLKLNKKTQIYIFKEFQFIVGEREWGSNDLIKKLDIEVLVEFFENFCEQNERIIIEKSMNYYEGLKFFFKNREEQAFKCLSFQLQMKILQDAPKDKKVWLFSLLSDKNRTKETLEKIKEIDIKEAEKFLFVGKNKNEIKIENKEVKDTNANTNSGLSKEAFKERLKMFNSNK